MLCEEKIIRDKERDINRDVKKQEKETERKKNGES